MIRLSFATALTVLGCAVSAGAQTILFAVDTDQTTLRNGNGLAEAGALHPDEIATVTPLPGLAYSAATFLGIGAQWAYLGDADQDGRLVDASTTAPGGDVDAVFVKHFGAAPSPVGPREVFLSKEDADGFAAGFQDGDVFRYANQGQLEVFVHEADLVAAMGQPASGDIDVDAICQSTIGDLFFSVDLTETVNGVSADDGAILWIPASAITYDARGDVTAIAAGSASVVASEADVVAMIQSSGMRTSVGGTPATAIDLSALELDPNGGVWSAPQQPGVVLPNLLFAWSGYSDDGAILSTAGGGTIAMANTVSIGSQTATFGTQIGLLPDSTGIDGLAGLAVVPVQSPPLTAELYPTRLITSSTILWTRVEVSSATPGAPVAFVIEGGPLGAGGVLPVITLPGFQGQLFGVGQPFVLGPSIADPQGFASLTLVMPSSIVGSMANFVWQAVDFGTATLSTPAPVQFL